MIVSARDAYITLLLLPRHRAAGQVYDILVDFGLVAIGIEFSCN